MRATTFDPAECNAITGAPIQSLIPSAHAIWGIETCVSKDWPTKHISISSVPASTGIEKLDPSAPGASSTRI
jgi:hypothetical protein